MNKWGNKRKAKPSTDKKQSKEWIQGFKDQMEKRKLYSPNKLKKDEQEKAYQIKKEKRVALKKPVAQRIANASFLVLFLLLILGAFNAFRHNGEISSLEDQVSAVSSGETKNQENYASRPGVNYFVENFMKTYMTVRPGEEEQTKRQEELTRFLANGLDKDAGIDYNALKGEQIYTSSRILEAEEVDQNQTDVYMDVNFTFISKQDKKVKEKKKGKDGKEKVVEKTVTETKETAGKAYYVVRIYSDEKGYTVMDLPQPFIPKQHEQKSVESAYANQTKDEHAAGNVRSFLESFFKAYVSKDRSKDMKFFFEHSEDAQSLNGAYQFVLVDDVDVYPGKGKDQWIARSHVKLKNPVTGVQSSHGYEFVLRQEGSDKFEILSMENLTNNVE
ncbi:conjugal transfer protein [Peribacillus castrilensis]|uniref:conjugal transfer protein n=1 Tax=Bacillaceae TaxID=186817 RepID=UPI0006607C3E|nr:MULTISPECIES: conjugal transfer protein [Bacillaceae]MCT1390128.1 conjugal transfer protein [Peribacillus frigoritolerans]NCT39981.1 hypothetical protein [Peribacillus frigoritolerans]PRA81593.1 hypothetical protein CQ056_20555 [Peribacillus simplex]